MLHPPVTGANHLNCFTRFYVTSEIKNHPIQHSSSLHTSKKYVAMAHAMTKDLAEINNITNLNYYLEVQYLLHDEREYLTVFLMRSFT